MKRAYLLSLVLLLALLVIAGDAAPTRAAPVIAPIDWRFGVIESYEAPGEASNLGVAWTRVRFQWAEVQSGGLGTWISSVDDGQINGELAAGRTVVGLLIGIPDWARENGLPRGLWLPHDDPNNAWASFVREAVTRYQGRINHWIIWNEPDINDPAAPGHTWPGSVEDFFQLQRTAYLAAKEANPNSTIHLPAFTHFWDPGYIHRFLDVLVADPGAAENNYYFDVATAHLYFQPNSIYDIIQSFYGAILGHGIPWKPVWLVETNAPPIDDPAWLVPNWTLSVTLDEQAAFIPQGMAAALAAGAQRVAIFKLKDTPSDRAANPEPFGLLREDGSRRPAFTTYQVAIRQMAGMTGVRRERWDAVGQIRLDQGEGSTTVLFSRLPAPQQAQVEATTPSAVLVDMWGSRRTISAVNGIFTVDLPGALCTQTSGDYCMIGGAPFYLVQGRPAGAAPPLPAAQVTEATVTDTPTVTPSATAAIEPTATATPTPSPTETPTSTPSSTATTPPTPTRTMTPPPSATATATAVATTTVSPAEVTKPTREANSAAGQPLSYWFIGGGFVLALAFGLGRWLNGRGQRPNR